MFRICAVNLSLLYLPVIRQLFAIFGVFKTRLWKIKLNALEKMTRSVLSSRIRFLYRPFFFLFRQLLSFLLVRRTLRDQNKPVSRVALTVVVLMFLKTTSHKKRLPGFNLHSDERPTIYFDIRRYDKRLYKC